MPIRIERPISAGNQRDGINVDGDPDLAVIDPVTSNNGRDGINIQTHPAKASPSMAIEAKTEGWWKRVEAIWVAPAIIVVLGAVTTYFLS